MALSKTQKQKIRELLEKKIEDKLKRYARESSSMPFLVRLIQDSEKVAAYSLKLYKKKVTITLRPTEFIVVGFKVPGPKDRWEEIMKFINNEIEKLLEGVAFLYGYFERRKNNNNPETPRIYLEVDSIEEEIDIYFSPDFANLFVEEIDISGGIEYMILDLEDKMKPKYGFYENNSAAWLHRIVKSISRIKNVTDVKEIVNLLCHFASDELYVPNSDLFQITPTEKLERFCEGILMDIWL